MGEELQPFDWGRMFLGDLSPLFLLEIVFRTTFMYFVALTAARVIGKRGMGQLTPFEYIVVIAMGSTAGTPMMEVQIPLLHGSMVLVCVVVIDSILARWGVRSPQVAQVLDAMPAQVVRAGNLQREVLLKEKIGMEEFKMMLRLHGIKQMGVIENAWLEPSGDLSLFLYDDEQVTIRDWKNGMGQSTFPEDLTPSSTSSVV